MAKAAYFISFSLVMGEKGPSLLMKDGNIDAPTLVNIFSKRFPTSKVKDRPFVSFELHGCYSGGFAGHFLSASTKNKNAFSPDFFFGSSPLYSISHTSYSRVNSFFQVKEKDADYNKDGVATLRELGVWLMNNGVTPLATMYNKRGSHDIDPEGKAAKKPYFHKSVKHIATHEKLLMEIDSLRFGEQAVVLLEGSNKTPNKIIRWYKDEAKNGDGFYKFLIIKDNPASRAYFRTNGKKTDGHNPVIFAVGPNLYRHGVELSFKRSVGNQIPEALANVDPIRVMADWHDKLKAHEGFNDIFGEVLAEFKANPNYSARNLDANAKKLMVSKDEDKQVIGLRLLGFAIQMKSNSSNISSVYSTYSSDVHHVAKQVIEDKEKPSYKLLLTLIRILGMVDTDAEKQARAKLMLLGTVHYPKRIAKEFAEDPILHQLSDSLEAKLLKGSVIEKINALTVMSSSAYEVTQTVANYVYNKCLTHKNPTLRHAAALFIFRKIDIYRSEASTIVSMIRSEDNVDIKILLFRILDKIQNTYGLSRSEHFNEIITVTAQFANDRSVPKSKREVTKKFLKKLREAKNYSEELDRRARALRIDALTGGGPYGVHDRTGGIVLSGDMHFKVGYGANLNPVLERADHGILFYAHYMFMDRPYGVRESELGVFARAVYYPALGDVTYSAGLTFHWDVYRL